jgi:hypothetical protein
MTGPHDLAWWTTEPQAIADARYGLLPVEKAWTWMHDGRAALVRAAYAKWPDISVLISLQGSTVTVAGIFGPAGNLRLLQHEATGPGGTVHARALRRLPAISALAAWEAVAREIARQILVDEVPADKIVIDGLAATEALDRLTVAARPRAREHRSRGEERRRLIERVAQTYREAVELGDPRPRTTIGRQLGYSSGHVGRLLMAARRPQGDDPPLLGPALPGKAGETRAEP